MPMQVEHAGVMDATSGEHLAGVPDEDMLAADGPVYARCDDYEHWTLVPTDVALISRNDGAIRFVVVEAVKASKGKAKGKDDA